MTSLLCRTTCEKINLVKVLDADINVTHDERTDVRSIAGCPVSIFSYFFLFFEPIPIFSYFLTKTSYFSYILKFVIKLKMEL